MYGNLRIHTFTVPHLDGDIRGIGARRNEETRMTPQEINELVARKLGHLERPIPGAANMVIYPDYATDIKAAWEIAEKYPCEIRKWVATTAWKEGETIQWDVFLWWGPNYKDSVLGQADTAPMAICLAFLKLEDK